MVNQRNAQQKKKKEKKEKNEHKHKKSGYGLCVIWFCQGIMSKD